MIDELYTPLEVAQMLRVTRTTIYEHIKNGQLKAIRIGNRYRISKAQLEEYPTAECGQRDKECN